MCKISCVLIFALLLRHISAFYYSCSNNKRIGVDGTSKTPSLALLKPTASSIGHRVARVADSFSFQYSYTLPNKNMDISPMKSICTPSHQQQGGIDNNEASETMSMDSPFHKQPIDPFRNIYLHDDESFDNKETISTSHQHYYNTHHSPPKRPLDHSPFPTPHVRRQSEPAVVKSTFYESRERIHQRNQVLDPVASQLLDQEETFVSHSSFLEEDPPLDSTACGDLDNVDRSYVRQHSLPNLSSPQDSPMPLFRKVSSSLHDVKTEDDLSLLARPVPRKLS